MKTSAVSAIMATRATFTGFAGKLGFTKITKRGFCYSTHDTPTIDDVNLEDGSGKGDMEVTVEGLVPNTTYYVRGYSVLSNGTLYYGNQQSFSTNNEYRVGDIGPAGGIIFYKDPAPMYYTYLEAILTGTIILQWGCPGFLINDADAGYMGYGLGNTESIVTQCADASYAAKYCYNLNLNGYSDWYLPTELDLDALYKYCSQNQKGNFSTDKYWTSTQYGQDNAYSFNFANGTYNFNEPKTSLCKIIAQRQF